MPDHDLLIAGAVSATAALLAVASNALGCAFSAFKFWFRSMFNVSVAFRRIPKLPESSKAVAKARVNCAMRGGTNFHKPPNETDSTSPKAVAKARVNCAMRGGTNFHKPPNEAD